MPSTLSCKAVHRRGSSERCERWEAHGAKRRASTSNTPMDASEWERIRRVPREETREGFEDEDESGCEEREEGRGGKNASAVIRAGEVGRIVWC